MSEQLVQTEFQILLKAFNELVKTSPEPNKIKTELLEIKEAAKTSKELNYRQTDAIVARVENYLDSTYGKNSKKENYKVPQ